MVQEAVVPAPLAPATRASFWITYVFLITTGTITFIEAIRTKDPFVRHVMNLETCVSIIAAVFYSSFIQQIQEADRKAVAPDPQAINLTRYADWAVSTPFMLFVLAMVLSKENGRVFTLTHLGIIILLDYAMLGLGYAGEVGAMDKNKALALSFAAFFGLFGFLWWAYVAGGKSSVAWFTFLAYLAIWSVYGIVYKTREDIKNTVFNVLDLVAKCLIGIFFWMYFTKSVALM